MTGLQSFSAEICSLICQDPIFKRLDLNSICFISHLFRSEAQRELSYRFPCLRGARDVKAWCLSLQSRPHNAIHVEGLVLLLPRPSAFRVGHIALLTEALHMCVNLKELVVLFQERHLRRPGLQEPKYSSTHILNGHQFKLTKFVNGYFCQDDSKFIAFLKSQSFLESLELHSGKTNLNILKGRFFFYRLKTLACLPQVLNKYGMRRLRLNFENSLDSCEIDVLGHVLRYSKKTRSLAIFLKQNQSHFSEIIRVIALSHIIENPILHLEIHQFFPTQVKKYLPLPLKFEEMRTQTLVFRPPPGLPKMVGDNPNLCAYVELRSPIGRRRVAEKLIKQILPTLYRLVLLVHGKNYEFRWDPSAYDVTGEILITRDAGEWALVK